MRVMVGGTKGLPILEAVSVDGVCDEDVRNVPGCVFGAVVEHGRVQECRRREARLTAAWRRRARYKYNDGARLIEGIPGLSARTTCTTGRERHRHADRQATPERLE